MASSTEAVSTPAIAEHPVRAALLLGALGVVFGDIGTSPIYAFRESLKAAGGASEAAVPPCAGCRLNASSRHVLPAAAGFCLVETNP